MPSKRQIQEQIDKLNKDMETADDDDDFVEVYRVKKSHLPWLFQQGGASEGESSSEDDGKDDGDDGEPPKEDPKPKPRSKYFGG